MVKEKNWIPGTHLAEYQIPDSSHDYRNDVKGRAAEEYCGCPVYSSRQSTNYDILNIAINAIVNFALTNRTEKCNIY